MKTIRTIAITALIALMTSLAPQLDTRTATAACSTFTVLNNIPNTTLKVFLRDAFGNKYGITAPPGNSTGWNPIPAAVESAAGNVQLLAPCSPCLTLTASGLGGNFCCVVCYDPNTCTMTINPCNAPCIP